MTIERDPRRIQPKIWIGTSFVLVGLLACGGDTESADGSVPGGTTARDGGGEVSGAGRGGSPSEFPSEFPSESPSGDSDVAPVAGSSDTGTYAGAGAGSGDVGPDLAARAADALARAYAEAETHTEKPLDLSALEAGLEQIPAEVEPSLDPSLILPGDPKDFPAATHIGGVPVRIIRERHPSTNVLLRIATVRATEADQDAIDASPGGARPILHGPEWLYHDSGALRSTLWWNQDVKHGPIKQWRPVGTCVFEGQFKNGHRHGLRREFSKAGKLLEVQVYADGNPHGPYRAWFAKGDKREEAYYVRGRYEGVRKSWGRTGLLVISEKYRHGLRDGQWSDFDPQEGTARTWGTYAAGKRVGIWQTGTPSGVLLESKEYADGLMHGEAKVWSPDGQLIERSHYQNGRQSGPSATWYASGKPQSEGELLDGARTGPWTYWREDGSVNDTWSGQYENDLRIELNGPLPPSSKD